LSSRQEEGDRGFIIVSEQSLFEDRQRSFSVDSTKRKFFYPLGLSFPSTSNQGKGVLDSRLLGFFFDETTAQ
jgi:hypothetical protein